MSVYFSKFLRVLLLAPINKKLYNNLKIDGNKVPNNNYLVVKKVF